MNKHLMRVFIAAPLVLGLAGTVSAHGSGQPGNRGNYGYMMRGMMGGQHGFGHGFGFRSRGHRFGGGKGFAARPLVSISLSLREELKLTESQIGKLETIRDDFARKAISGKAEIRTLRIDLRQALDAKSVDLNNVEKIVRTIARKRADISLARLRAIDRGKKILTADQRKQLRTLLARRWRGGSRFGHGFGMGPGYGYGMGPGQGVGPRQGMGPGQGMGPSERR